MYWDELIQLILYFFFNLNVSYFLVFFSHRFPNSLISLFSFLFVAFDSVIHQPWKRTLVNRQDYNFPNLVEVPSKYQKTWWNTRWLNERYLPSICMRENKIRLFLQNTILTVNVSQVFGHCLELPKTLENWTLGSLDCIIIAWCQ